MSRTLFVSVVVLCGISEPAKAALLKVEFEFDPRGAAYSIRSGIGLKSGHTLGGEVISIPDPLVSQPPNHSWAAYEFEMSPTRVSHGVWLGAMLGNSSYAAGTGTIVRIVPEPGESVGGEVSVFFHMLKTDNPGGIPEALTWAAITNPPASVSFYRSVGTEVRTLHIGDRFRFSLDAQANPGFDPNPPRVGAALLFQVSLDSTPPPPPVGLPPPVPDYIPGNDGGNMTRPDAERCVWIIHGMNDAIRLDDPNHWTSTMKQVEFDAGGSLHTWNWQRGAEANIYAGLVAGPVGLYTVGADIGRAYRNANFEGIALANEIKQHVDSGECRLEDIRLIGHSFGGVVAAVAADILASDYSLKSGQERRIDQLVLIDTPKLSFLSATDHVDSNSAKTIVNLFGGRWEGAVGGPIDGANVWNLGVDLPGRGMLPNPLFMGHLQMPSYWPGIQQSIQNWVANQPAGVYHEVSLPGGTITGIAPGAPSYAFNHIPLVVPLMIALPAFQIETLQDWQGFGATLEERDGRLAVKGET